MKGIAGSVCLILFLCIGSASAEEISFNWNKKWETTLGLGYKIFTNSEVKSKIDNAGTVLLRFQKRVGYPVLIGLDGEASLTGDIAYFRLGVPVALRLNGFGKKSKFDLNISPGMVHVTNTETDVKQLGIAGNIGLEFKYFYRTGYSLGVGGYYTIVSNKMDNFVMMLILGF